MAVLAGCLVSSSIQICPSDTQSKMGPKLNILAMQNEQFFQILGNAVFQHKAFYRPLQNPLV